MPEWKADIRARLAHVSLAPAREADIVEELSQHLEDRWRELVAGGVDPLKAEELARADLRDGHLLAQHLAPLRQSHWCDPAPMTPRRWFALGGLTTDLRDALRSLRGAPGFTAVVLIVLTLGMGATTAIFSVVDAVVLRPLPFDDPDQLVAVGERSPAAIKMGPLPGGDPLALRYGQPQNYLDWAAQQQVFSAIAAIASSDVTFFPDGGAPESLLGQRVTGSFFDVLRIRPALGRFFTADAEVEGRHRLVVLSDTFWRQRFAADPHVIGRRIALDDGSYEVVGVLPAGVSYPVGAINPPDIWVPYVVPADERVRGRGHSTYLQSIARLKPGVSLAQAEAGMNQIAAGIERANPQWNRGFTIGVRPLRDHLVGASIQSWMLMLLTAVGIVLMIACANVANLLLARASARQSEVGIRAALGAGRWRLARQFIVESLVLSLAGTALAVIAASWMIEILRAAMPDSVPRVTTIGVNLRVLGTAAAAAIVTGVLFGVVPALQLASPNLASSFTGGTRTAGANRRRQRLRRALVIAEIALSVVLLVGAALFIGSFIRVMRVETGFNPDRVLTAQLYKRPLPGQPRPNWSAPFMDIADRLAHAEGVVSAAAVGPGIPLSPRQRIDGLVLPGRPIDKDSEVSIKFVTPDYFRTLGIPLTRGRFFDGTDRAGAQAAIILSESTARYFFGADDPIGRAAGVSPHVDAVVVGVVGDARQDSLEGDLMHEVYLPMGQSDVNSGYLVVRTAGDPYSALPAAKTVVASVLPGVAVREISSMEELIGRKTAQRRLNMLMLGLFALLGLVISAVGVYGVMAFVVAQRTREIGVRMALGATRSQIISMVLRNAVVLLVAGVAVGAMGAWYLSATANQFLFELEAHDLRAFGAAVGVLSLACLIATIVPARRAASVDPTIALRSE